jgi:hypothetical protein
MVAVIIFQVGDGSLSVVLANECDGAPTMIIREIDPFALGTW